jgi:hypothetical protein
LSPVNDPVNIGGTQVSGLAPMPTGATPVNGMYNGQAVSWPTSGDNARALAQYQQTGGFGGYSAATGAGGGFSSTGENVGGQVKSPAQQLAPGKQLGVENLTEEERAQRASAGQQGNRAGAQGQQQGGMPGGGGAGKPGQKDGQRKRKYIMDEQLDVGEILRTSDRVVGIPDEEIDGGRQNG